MTALAIAIQGRGAGLFLSGHPVVTFPVSANGSGDRCS
jgi:hypothetical protein